MRHRVVIIGGGWAGLAAGAELSRGGLHVTLLEAGRILGGRARSPGGGSGGMSIDWGQHLFLGGYVETIKLLEMLGTRPHLKPVGGPVDFHDGSGRTGKAELSSLPFPLNLLGSLFSLSHLGVRERLGLGKVALAVFRSSPAGRERLERITATAWLEGLGQSAGAIRRFWRPLVVSALNEEPERASASMLEVVLRRGFFAGGEASMPHLPDVPLGDLVALPAKNFIGGRGGDCRTGCRVTRLRMTRGKVRKALLAGGEEVEGDLFISAVPFGELAPLLGSMGSDDALALKEKISRLRPSPIVTLFLRTDRRIIRSAYAGLLDGNFHWIFDRTGLSGAGGGFHDYALVASAARGMVGRRREELLRLARDDIELRIPGSGGFGILAAKVVKERNATLAPLPSSSCDRPAPDALLGRGLLLAGDWTSTGLPATLEGAVSSGFECARIARNLLRAA
jgi:squalene-associated FAD-dependent desaturase